MCRRRGHAGTLKVPAAPTAAYKMPPYGCEPLPILNIPGILGISSLAPPLVTLAHFRHFFVSPPLRSPRETPCSYLATNASPTPTMPSEELLVAPGKTSRHLTKNPVLDDAVGGEPFVAGDAGPEPEKPRQHVARCRRRHRLFGALRCGRVVRVPPCLHTSHPSHGSAEGARPKYSRRNPRLHRVEVA